MYEYKAEVLEVIEADCLRLKIDLGLDANLEIICLLQGVQTPHRGVDGSERASEFTRAWCNNRDNRVLVTTVKVVAGGQGRYRVWVTDWLGHSLNEGLLQAHLGVSLSA